MSKSGAQFNQKFGSPAEEVGKLKEVVRFWIKVCLVVGPVVVGLLAWLMQDPISQIYGTSTKLGELSGQLSGVPGDIERLQDDVTGLRERVAPLDLLPQKLDALSSKVDVLAILPSRVETAEKRMGEVTSVLDAVKSVPTAIDSFRKALDKTETELRLATEKYQVLEQALTELKKDQAKANAELAVTQAAIAATQTAIAATKKDIEGTIEAGLTGGIRFLARIDLKQPISAQPTDGGTEYVFYDEIAIQRMRRAISTEAGQLRPTGPIVIERIDLSGDLSQGTIGGMIAGDRLVVRIWSGDRAAMQQAMDAKALAVSVHLVQR